jgi:hypothetical protein
MSTEERQKIALIDFEQRKAGRLLGGEARERLEASLAKSLGEAQAENLSLYSAQEEIAQLEAIAAVCNFPVAIVPIGEDDHNLGYMIVPKYAGDRNPRRPIIIEAAIDFLDYDDTLAQTSKKKHECWSELEKLGISMSIVKHCDKMARLTFQAGQGSIYEPELDMRLLTHALSHLDLDESELKQEINNYLQQILSSRGSANEIFKTIPVDIAVRDIFNRTRFTVEPYPDTDEILRSLQGEFNEDNSMISNVFVLTYGDPLYQFAKALPLLKDGAVQAIFLTKARKGPFLKQLFKQDPFKHSTQIDAHHPVWHMNTHTLNRGFDPEGEFPIALTDDDPEQVASVDELANELGFMIAARRLLSPDQKRAGSPTPVGQRVIELHRDANLCITEDMKKIQVELYAQAIFAFLVRRFAEWVDARRGEIYKEDKKYPYVDEFLRGWYGTMLAKAAKYQMIADGSEDEAATLYKLKNDLFSAAVMIVNEQINI